MKNIDAKISEIKVNRFFPRDGGVELLVYFNDGEDKHIPIITTVDNPSSLGQRILLDIRRMIKSSKQYFDGKDFLDSHITVTIFDEENIEEKIVYFLEKLKSKIHDVKTASKAEGYINMVRDVTQIHLKL